MEAAEPDPRATSQTGPGAPPTTKRSQQRVGGHRWAWLVASALCLTVATVIAFLQPLHSNPMDQVPTGWKWFTEPLERNAWLRLNGLTVPISSVHFVDNVHGWAVGDSGTILATDDGGTTWRRQTSGTSRVLHSVHFSDANRGWAVGDFGTILTTDDGGAVWRSRTSGTKQSLECVYFFEGTRGWAVGYYGTILATTDGGATWKSQERPPSGSLHSVYFSDADRGWAVGDGGTILATRDGGETWGPQTSGTTNALTSVYFSSVDQGWVVGDKGTILVTRDGGKAWERQTSGTTDLLYSVYFFDLERGWAAGANGTIVATGNGGAGWTPQTSRTRQHLRSVYFSGASRGWVAGDSGTLLATGDRGMTWNTQASRYFPFARSVYFPDADRGWAVGHDGMILATSDGGATWKIRKAGTSEDEGLVSVYFADATHGWAVGGTGTIIATIDGGANWRRQSPASTMSLYSVYFPNATLGWAVGDVGTILATRDGGETWELQKSGESRPIRSVYFADERRGWAVSDGGTILATTDSGKTWTPQTSIPESLESVYFSDANRGWAVGLNGTILTTGDGGRNWEPQTSHTSQGLVSVHFYNAKRGWVVGECRTFLLTRDGGEHWQGPAPPSRLPAPWYYVAALLCVCMAVLGLRPEVVIAPAESAANRQISDNPIGPKDFDALGLSEIAVGLSQFFRNIDTKPPLTVGILGEWGQGKSSVMRLLEADLRTNGVYPVWFNAWHYQKEDHLLAYLLEAIRQQAVPRIQTLQGLRFRARLLGLRAARGRWTLASFVIVLAFCAGLLRHPRTMSALSDWAGNVGKHSSVSLGQLTILGISVGTAILFIKQIYEGLGAFHVNPAALIKEAAGSASIKDLDAKASVRAAFAKEFNDVTGALEPYRMVIFIDDLDRCSPRSITQILESVNFLVSAGNCFVVMGLAKPQVEASIGLSFKDVAEEMRDEGDAKTSRREYAQQYLRKLINLEVKVPAATPEQQELLLVGHDAREKPKTLTYAERVVNFGRANRSVAWVICTVLLATVSLWYGLNLKVDGLPTLPQVAQGPVTVGRVENTSMPSPSTGKPPSEDPGTSIFLPGLPETRQFLWLTVLPFLVVLGIGVWVFTRRPDEIIRDSKNFVTALEIWRPVIAAQYKTPREIKRFLNRLRYIVMRWRQPSLQHSLFERLGAWIESRIKHSQAQNQKVQEINEAGIVLMAALEPFGGKSASSSEDISRALLRHSQKFGQLGEDWLRFCEITGEIEAN